MDLRSIEFAHDLKMPIQLIYSCVQLLEMEMPAGSRAAGYLSLLMQSAGQIQQMVSRALEESGPRRGAGLRLSRRNVVADARAISRQCAICAAEKGVRVGFSTNASSFEMRTDAEKLSRILNNLLANALKYTPRGGRVTLEVSVLGDAAEFCVADTGCGIAPGDQARIFERGVTTDGSGYGLAIVRDYAALLGGSVRVESVPGCGSRFTLRLPVRGDCVQAG